MKWIIRETIKQRINISVFYPGFLLADDSPEGPFSRPARLQFIVRPA